MFTRNANIGRFEKVYSKIIETDDEDYEYKLKSVLVLSVE